MVHYPPPPTKATKAFYAGVAATASAIATVFADGKLGIPECAVAAAGVVGIIGGVYGVTNGPKQETQGP